MGAEQQQGSGKQLDLFDEALKATLRHDVSGKGGTGAGMNVERQAPTVVDRLVQQAILQVLEPLFDPTFSASSHGFRPGAQRA
jgi:retron-type reverse transcriptase